MGKLGKGAVEKEKKTKKEIEKELADEAKKNAKAIAEAEDGIARIRRTQKELDQQGEKTEEDIDLSDFEELLARFMRGELNVSSLSVKIYEKIQKSAALKKSFLETPQGQLMAAKVADAVKNNPNAANDPSALPLLSFLGHVSEKKLDKEAAKKKLDKEAAKKKLEDDGWEFVEHEYKKPYLPKTITVEEGKKEQDEAMEALRKFHEEMGIKPPDELKKELKAQAEQAAPVKGM